MQREEEVDLVCHVWQPLQKALHRSCAKVSAREVLHMGHGPDTTDIISRIDTIFLLSYKLSLIRIIVYEYHVNVGRDRFATLLTHICQHFHRVFILKTPKFRLSLSQPSRCIWASVRQNVCV